MWGTAAWDNDDAADWFADLFAATKLAQRVEKTLKKKNLDEYAGQIRAAAYLLLALGRVYIWPQEDLERHLRLAIEKLEAARELEEYKEETDLIKCIDREIAELGSRLQALDAEPGAAADGDANRLVSSHDALADHCG